MGILAPRKMMSEGLASEATKFLNTASVPELHHWMDEEWVERLYRLAQYGVKPEEFMGWAYHVGADDEQDIEDVVERVDMKTSALTENEAVASPVVAILGRPVIPKKARWSDPSWARALYDLQPQYGVRLAAFQAWAREACDEAIMAMQPPEPADLESLESSFLSAGGSEERLLESARMAHNDTLISEPVPELIDWPPPPATYVEIVVDVGGWKRAPGSRSDNEGDCSTSQQGRRRRSGKSPE